MKFHLNYVFVLQNVTSCSVVETYCLLGQHSAFIFRGTVLFRCTVCSHCPVLLIYSLFYFECNTIQYNTTYQWILRQLPYLADRHHYEWFHACTWIKIILLAKPWIYHINDVINGERCFCNISRQYHLKQIPNRQYMTAQSLVPSIHYITVSTYTAVSFKATIIFVLERKAKFLTNFYTYL